jgi:decaprenylphospho-beta-D-erythro-pentofuranosid-2-ulose 2-reductase
MGGTSEIGMAVVEALRPARGTEVVLVGRDRGALAAVGDSLPCDVSIEEFEATGPDHQELVGRLAAGGPVDIVLMAFGILGDARSAARSPRAALEILDVDFRAQVELGLLWAEALRAQGHGTLVFFSSIAGVRARRANFMYGAAKAGLDAFASGLGDSLQGSGVRVLVVRPGFVRGRMTAGMTPAPFAVDPQAVGRAAAEAWQKGASQVWVPPVLRIVATGMRLTPRPLWRRLSR